MWLCSDSQVFISVLAAALPAEAGTYPQFLKYALPRCPQNAYTTRKFCRIRISRSPPNFFFLSFFPLRPLKSWKALSLRRELARTTSHEKTVRRQALMRLKPRQQWIPFKSTGDEHMKPSAPSPKDQTGGKKNQIKSKKESMLPPRGFSSQGQHLLITWLTPTHQTSPPNLSWVQRIGGPRTPQTRPRTGFRSLRAHPRRAEAPSPAHGGGHPTATPGPPTLPPAPPHTPSPASPETAAQ